MASTVLSLVQYYLVRHPTILNFQWIPGSPLASTPHFLTLSILTYLCLTLLLSLFLRPLPSLPNSLLKPITALHSLTLSLLSLIMAIGCLLSFSTLPSPLHAICFPPNTPPTGPLFFWAHVFYLSKLLEFNDTFLIILSKSNKRLTFLHVYHHATVLVMCYFWLLTRQSLFPVALVTNSIVHVVMYFYYLLCALGFRPKWKRLVTDFQIVQFVFSFAVSMVMLYWHFSDVGCSGIWGWCFNAGFNASLLALFVDFHGKSYANKRTSGEDKNKRQ